jgi:hypothetical protein
MQGKLEGQCQENKNPGAKHCKHSKQFLKTLKQGNSTFSSRTAQGLPASLAVAVSRARTLAHLVPQVAAPSWEAGESSSGTGVLLQ